MLRTPSFLRYAVKLKKNLPHGQLPVPVLARSLASSASLCESLLRDCERDTTAVPPLAAWQQVRRMQIVSIHHVLEQLASQAGMNQTERLFEKAWNSTGTLGRTMGRARAGKRGQNLPSNRSLTMLEDRLASLYRGQRWPLHVDCYQLLWLSLLVDQPILASAEELLQTHHQPPSEHPNFPNLLTMGLPILETGSTWKFDLWVGTRHASLPHLAGSIVLMRVCLEKGQRSVALQIARVICQLLAMLGPELQARGIGALMLRYCAQHILPIAGAQTSASEIARAAAVLNLAAQSAWDDGVQVEWEVRMRIMSEILHGAFDSRLQFFCDPTSLSTPPYLVAKWARELCASRFEFAGERVCAEAYRDRVIDMPALIRRVPAVSHWLRSDPRLVPRRSRRTARPRSWCAELSKLGSPS